eukprot:g1932.t1
MNSYHEKASLRGGEPRERDGRLCSIGKPMKALLLERLLGGRGPRAMTQHYGLSISGAGIKQLSEERMKHPLERYESVEGGLDTGGGFGRVREMRDTTTGEPVIVKTQRFSPNVAESEAAMAVFAADRPDLVQVHEVLKHGQELIVVMEKLERCAHAPDEGNGFVGTTPTAYRKYADQGIIIADRKPANQRCRNLFKYKVDADGVAHVTPTQQTVEIDYGVTRINRGKTVRAAKADVQQPSGETEDLSV